VPAAPEGWTLKVVLFCGGLGMRVREYADNIPKPMIPIGHRPILWHVMKYYAHFGHKDFILCLGYRSDLIKNYFLNYDECLSNDFVISAGGKKVELLGADIADWRITFVDTGINSNLGQRLKAVESHLAGEKEFLVNYSDGLTDLPLNVMIEDFHAHDKVASFLCVKPNLGVHFVTLDSGGRVTAIQGVDTSDVRINGGYFVFKSEIFGYIRNGEDLVPEPFRRLVAAGELIAYPYDGFWMSMDTFKDKQRLDEVYAGGEVPWEVWKNDRRNGPRAGV
jgi:glucose-1-phosphate cytidylyltransferase